MKKEFNFKNIKGMLSRDEMKAIRGGINTTLDEGSGNCGSCSVRVGNTTSIYNCYTAIVNGKDICISSHCTGCK